MRNPRICKLKIICDRTDVRKRDEPDCVNKLLIDSEVIPNNGCVYANRAFTFKKADLSSMRYKASDEKTDIFEMQYINYTVPEDMYKQYFPNLFTSGHHYTREDLAEIFSNIIEEKVIGILYNKTTFLDCSEIITNYCRYHPLKVRLLLRRGAKFLPSENITKPIIVDAYDLITFNSLMISTMNNALSEMYLQINNVSKVNDDFQINLQRSYSYREEIKKFLYRHEDEVLHEFFQGKFEKFLIDSGLCLDEKWIDDIVDNCTPTLMFLSNKKGENNETK